MALPPGATISAVTTLQTSTAPGACKVSFRYSFYHSGPAGPADRSRQERWLWPSGALSCPKKSSAGFDLPRREA
jgi:hypothetical protein